MSILFYTLYILSTRKCEDEDFENVMQVVKEISLFKDKGWYVYYGEKYGTDMIIKEEFAKFYNKVKENTLNNIYRNNIKDNNCNFNSVPLNNDEIPF